MPNSGATTSTMGDRRITAHCGGSTGSSNGSGTSGSTGGRAGSRYHGATSGTCWTSIRCVVRVSVMPRRVRGVLHEEPSASVAPAGVCEGGGRRGYGAHKRARSRKRRTRPRGCLRPRPSFPTRSKECKGEGYQKHGLRLKEIFHHGV